MSGPDGLSLRGLRELSRSYLLQSFRSRTSLFWNFAFPLFWLFLFAVVFGSGEGGVTFLMPGLFTITVVAISFAGVSYRLIGERERGILRRYRATPVSALTVVLANASASAVILAISLALLWLVAGLVFGVTVTGGAWEMVVVLAGGAVAFTPLGLILGSVAPSQRAAPAIANAIFFPLIFISGAAMPFSLLPGWLQEVGRLVPATYLVEGLYGVMIRGASPGELVGPLAVLVATGVVSAALAALLFRWESRTPVEARRLGAALAMLVVVFVAVWRLAPPLEIARAEWDGAAGMEQMVPGAGEGAGGAGSGGADSR